MAEQEDLSILSGWLQYAQPPHPLYDHLTQEAYRHLEERSAQLAGLRTAEDWRRRQAEVRKTLMELVGPFPERTPLEAQVIGVIPRQGYRIEKVIFQSQPGFYVTACLLVPEGLQARAPGIVYLLGHSDNGFRYMNYQTFVLNLVQKGFVVLTFDPLGQGERLQYFDEAIGRSRIGSCTVEHSYAGVQCFLSGSCLARYRIWDAIRAVDYLASRSEVDPARIGAAGRSGGGTLSTYLAAFDDRILAAAPANYITNFRRLLESIGPQDAEQNLPRGIAAHIDHADLLAVRAPKPLLIRATTRDFFSIQGARETYAELRRVYEALGAPDHLRMAEDDIGHATTPKLSETLYSFLQEFLQQPGNPAPEPVELLSADELQVTTTGQVSTSLGGETVYSLNRRGTEPLLAGLAARRQNPAEHLPAVRTAAARLSGYRAPAGPCEPLFAGRYRREGYAVEKYMVQGEGRYMLPYLFLRPSGPGPFPALLYLDSQGKAAGAEPGGAMEWFARRGIVVLAPDLLGTGELAGTALPPTHAESFCALLIGRSIVGVHAGDIVRLIRCLQAREDVLPEGIMGLARGYLGPALLHAAALDEGIGRVALVEAPLSYRAAVMNRFYELDPAALVPAALTAYDLPDLAASLAPRRLLLVDPVDHNGNKAGRATVEEEFAVARAAYGAAGGSLDVRRSEAWHTPEDLFGGWLC